MKALLLGASGEIGRRTAGELARAEEVTSLVVASRSQEGAATIARTLGGPQRGVEPRAFDISDDRALKQAVANADVVVNAAGPAWQCEPPILNAVRGAKTAYVSLCDDADVFSQSMHQDDSSLSILLGAGFSPGLTDLMAQLAASELDSVDEVDVSIALSLGDSFGPATLISLARFLEHDAAPKQIYFPEPVGWVEVFPSRRPEVVALPREWPDAAVSLRAGLAEPAGMDALRAVAAAGSRRASTLALVAARPVLQSLPPTRAPWSAARVNLRGLRDGRRTTVALGVADHLVNLAATPLSRAAIALGGGSSVPTGVHTLAAFSPKPFLRAISDRGVRVARLEPYVV